MPRQQLLNKNEAEYASPLNAKRLLVVGAGRKQKIMRILIAGSGRKDLADENGFCLILKRQRNDKGRAFVEFTSGGYISFMLLDDFLT